MPNLDVMPHMDMWGNYMPAEYEEDEFFTPYVFDYKPNMNLNAI